MNSYLIAMTNACTLVTLNYIALKWRTRVEAYARIAVPLLTGIASIIMMLVPLPDDLVLEDFRFAPIVMAGLRFGFSASLLSIVLPACYLWLTEAPDLMHGLVLGLLIPAVVSSILHRKQYESGYSSIKKRDGIFVCLGLFLLRIASNYVMNKPGSLLSWMQCSLIMLAISAAAVIVLIVMFNDENKVWLAQRQLEMQANQDGLTKLPNLRSFLEIAGNTLRNQSIAILMIDIDNFKHFNDRHGHLQGDKLLREVGRMLRNLIRDQDYVARYGGEEFVAMCLTSDSNQLAQIAGRLCQTIAGHSFSDIIGQEERISISIGVSTSGPDQLSLLELIDRADAALYESKHTGKNKFTFYEYEIEKTVMANA